MDILVKEYNEVHVKVICDSGIAMELAEHFSFFVPGYKFMQKFKIGMWDGRIRIFNSKNYTIYKGLLHYLVDFAKARDYTIDIQDNLDVEKEFSVHEAKQFIETLYQTEKLDRKFIPRDYQLNALIQSVQKKRRLVLSPTGSGKSLIIYLLTMMYGGRKLIIVPTISLVLQMTKDFKEYSISSMEDKILGITGTTDKEWKKTIRESVVISTWQSISKMPPDFFNSFNVIIGDEAHLFTAQSLCGILEKAKNVKYRFGFTGTLDGAKANQLVLEGLFGKVYSTITTKELMNRQELAELNIKLLMLKYSINICKIVKGLTYDKEMKFITSYAPRNEFIKNLTVSLSGNTLLLFQYVDSHGKILYDLIKSAVSAKRKVFFVFGGTKGEQRDSVRTLVETETDAIIIASSGVFSTGINIKNLHNIIFTSPSKSKIRNLQSIGRGLRVSDTKTTCTLFDIGDDFEYNGKMNYTMRHMLERVKYYNQENFDYKIYKIDMEKQNER